MFYQQTKTMKAAVMGTIAPWSGALSEVPKGWILCDGSAVEADQFPLLAQAIGDTYNQDPNASNFGGSFPNYDGDILLPNLNQGRFLMDIEETYFGNKNNTIDDDADAKNIIAPFIGVNTDVAAPTVFTDVYTDVVFTLNDRLGYSGNISGNTIIPGDGEKTMFIGGRKLGHTHIRQHSHGGSYETISANPASKPGIGTIPWDNIEIDWTHGAWDNTSDTEDSDGFIDEIYFEYEQFYKGEQLRNNGGDFTSWTNLGTGFGGGQAGRVVGATTSEAPPVNLIPFSLARTPIASKGEWIYNQLDSDDTIAYGRNGNNISVPAGYRNFYEDSPSLGTFGTLISNNGSGWTDSSIQAHAHEPFAIIYQQSSLKPQSRLVASVNIPVNTTLDNATNVGALQIDMNTSQPSLTVVYIIRAY
tara:strand:+ start:12167 stop:13414 length:1248 start_codon:yes stop_codon:yes gene_type:complete